MAQAKRVPTGQERAIPHLVVDNAAAAIDFYRKAFGAEELMRMPAPDGRRLFHAEIRLGASVIYLCDDFPEMCGGRSQTPKALGGTPVTIHHYVEDCDAAIQRALEAGATVVRPPEDMFWGDRYGVVEDPFGHHWSFASHVRDVSPQEMAAAVEAMARETAAKS